MGSPCPKNNMFPWQAEESQKRRPDSISTLCKIHVFPNIYILFEMSGDLINPTAGQGLSEMYTHKINNTSVCLCRCVDLYGMYIYKVN
uniref:Uncharacterized protein n=1 Tax=Rhizophora mucronata TaxID=61149 RepID=A0A2P2PP38_RHIMU